MRGSIAVFPVKRAMFTHSKRSAGFSDEKNEVLTVLLIGGTRPGVEVGGEVVLETVDGQIQG